MTVPAPFVFDPAVKAHTRTLERLETEQVAWLGTIGRDGYPHAVPIWFLYEDGTLIMTAGARSQKVRNITRNAEVALTVDRRSLPYYAVMVQGTAEIGPPPSDDLRRRIAVRYLGEDLPADEWVSTVDL